jgi:hypothetical protein
MVTKASSTSLLGGGELSPYYYPTNFFQMSEAAIKKWAEGIVGQIIRIIDEQGGGGEWSQGRHNAIMLQVKKFLGTSLMPDGSISPYSVLGRLEAWVATTTESAFASGAVAAGEQLYVAGVTSMYTLNEAQLKVLISDTFGSLAQSVEQTEKDISRRLNMWKYATLRSRTKAQMLRGILKGENMFVTAKELAADLNKNGIVGFTDKAGKRWNLESYAAMVVRTKMKETHTAGFLDSYMAVPNSVMPKLVEIRHTMYADKHKDDSCRPYQEQRYWALNAQDGKKYKLPVLKKAPPFHPQCEHLLTAYVPRSEKRSAEHARRLENVQARHASVRERVRSGEINEGQANSLLLRGLQALNATVTI